jgi:glutamate synthase (NADPH/NADH) large chain
MMMIPEAWAGNPLMDEERRAFYEYNAALMEPWDGPAAIAFTNGRQIGATLDRNGLRPARYLLTRDDRIVMASEVGVLPIPEKDIIKKWRLQPGKMLLVDLDEGRLIPDEELKATLGKEPPLPEWLARTQIVLEELPGTANVAPISNLSLLDRQQAFGYTQEDIKFLMAPMATTGEEAVGSMGNDTPISALSNKPKSLFTYFKQNFAQVTNPPIDPIREELVMSLVSIIGPRPNLLDHEGMSNTKRLEVRQPILTNEDLEKIRSISEMSGDHFKSRTFDITFPAEHGPDGMGWAIDELCERAEEEVRNGCNIIILSDRKAGADRIPIPALLACAAVHHHLIRNGLRTSVGMVLETGEPREVHHFACLAGYGAEAINPYLAFETLTAMKDDLPGKPTDDKEVVKKYIKAIGKGLLKVMSKMGISTYQSYCGAQIFDAVGLRQDFVDKYFTGTHTRIEGVGLAEIAEEAVRRHRDAFSDAPIYRSMLDVGGDYAGARTRRGPRLDRGDSVAACSTRCVAIRRTTIRAFRADRERAERAAADHPRDVPPQEGRGRQPQTGPLGRSRAGQDHRAAVLDGRHVVRLDLARGPHDAGDRHEPHRRQIEHREGGEESDRFKPLRTAIRCARRSSRSLGPLRRHRRVSRQFRRDADQDGAGRKARRRRPVARAQGRQDHRQGPPLDSWRRPDLAAAAP